MQERIVNHRDLEFVLYEFLSVHELPSRERYREHSKETFNAVIDSAYRIATERFLTHARKSDDNEPRIESGRVEIVAEVKQALQAFCQAGFMAASVDATSGGMQLPMTVAQAALAIFKGANIGTEAYALLTSANANLISKFGSTDQKHRYLPHLLSGRFLGTMCLSEPQAGSSLSDIVTRAEPQTDGTYRLFGSKMWISGGDHELSENIVHLVLAKIRGAPIGVKGISLFIVPKYLVNEDGSIGTRNDVVLAGLNHKMGYRGTVNCALNFGEKDGAVGYLVGEPHNGLSYMFHMMNEARVGIGMGAVMLGYSGYLHALEYARQRLQGRPGLGKDPAKPQVRIIEHPDVRRMLLSQKAYVEGGLALCLYAAWLVDEVVSSEDEVTREEARLLLEMLTPIVKAWPSQWCLAANDLAIQVHGGYGYSREYPVERLYRDNRLNAIHEGTNGIQALDLVGRKVRLKNGAAMDLLTREISRSIEEARAARSKDLRSYGDQLSDALASVGSIAHDYRANSTEDGAEAGLANAHVFLEMCGHVVVAWMWLRQALVATKRLSGALDSDRDFYQGKLQACRFFFRWELPKTVHWGQLLRNGEATCLKMRDLWF
jgi:alkylation response protein AidB-like acyl-CoA dehydrogenase